jgi:alpha/beta superfamily hydrolase
MARRIESLFLTGPAGRLEALLEEPEALLEEPEDGGGSLDTTRLCAVVCHPHPLYGGTMHNKVVYRMARGLRRAGIVVLRFNFRGVGASEGRHANYIGEVEDARAALEWLRGRYPQLGYALAGFSFGARVITRLGCSVGQALPPANAARFLMAAGFPTDRDGLEYLASCRPPKIFIQSTHDQYGPRAALEAAFADFAEPKRLLWVEAEDHFFAGGLDQLEETVREAVHWP